MQDEGSCERPYVAEGCLIDLFGPGLPVYDRLEVAPGTQKLLYDVRKAGKAPQILAAGSRSYDERRGLRRFSYVCKGPQDTYNVTRILLPRAPKAVLVDGAPCPASWDDFSRTALLRFPNNPEGVRVQIKW